MNVRPATLDDLEAISRIAEKTWKDAYSFVPEQDIEEIISEWYSTEQLRKDAKHSNSIFLVTENDEVTGFCHAIYENGEADLKRIYVDPDHQEAGAGTRLLENCLEILRNKGVQKVELEVFAKNKTALNFYEKHGFELKEEKETSLKGKNYRDKVLVKEI